MSPSHKALAAALLLSAFTSANLGYIERRALWSDNAEGVSFGYNPGGGAFSGSFGSGGADASYSFPGMPNGIPTGIPAGVPTNVPIPDVPKSVPTVAVPAPSVPKPDVPVPAVPKPEVPASADPKPAVPSVMPKPAVPSVVPKPDLPTPVIPIPSKPSAGAGAGTGAGASGAGSGSGSYTGIPGGFSTARPSMVPIPEIPGSPEGGAGGQGGVAGAGGAGGAGGADGGAPTDPNEGIGENGIIPTVASGIGPNGVAEGLVLGGYYGEYNPLTWFNGRANTFGNANYVIYPPYNIFPYNPFLNYGKAARVRIAHAALAAATFVFILPVGGIAVRILPGPIGVAVHVLLQLTGYTLFVAAVGMGIWMSLYIRSPHFYMLTWYHQIIGLIIFGLITLQPLGGILHHLTFRRHGRRSFISFLHTWIGRLIITLGMINGGLGLLMAANAKRRYVIAYSVIAAGMWVIYITIGILGEIRLIFKRKPKKQDREHDRDRDSHVAPPAPHYAEFDPDMEEESTDVNETETETEMEPRRTSSSTMSSWEADKELRTYGYA